MKMPKNIDDYMLAPCGINCMVCRFHCNTKKTCSGCLGDDSGKYDYCSRCKIKLCTLEKGIQYCYKCETFPCKLIKNLEKRYQTRYGSSPIANSLTSKTEGISSFMEKEKEKWTCPQCSGIISLHDDKCSECKNDANKRSII